MFTKQNKENRPINQSGGTKKILKKPYRHMGKDTTLRHKLGFETPHTKKYQSLLDLVLTRSAICRVRFISGSHCT
jgi:hypothetical protein